MGRDSLHWNRGLSLSVGNSNIQIGKPTRPWPRTDGGVPKAMTLRRDEAVN